MSHTRVDETLAFGGIELDRAFQALRRTEPGAHAFYVYDLDAIEARARRFRAAPRR